MTEIAASNDTGSTVGHSEERLDRPTWGATVVGLVLGTIAGVVALIAVTWLAGLIVSYPNLGGSVGDETYDVHSYGGGWFSSVVVVGISFPLVLVTTAVVSRWIGRRVNIWPFLAIAVIAGVAGRIAAFDVPTILTLDFLLYLALAVYVRRTGTLPRSAGRFANIGLDRRAALLFFAAPVAIFLFAAVAGATHPLIAHRYGGYVTRAEQAFGSKECKAERRRDAKDPHNQVFVPSEFRGDTRSKPFLMTCGRDLVVDVELRNQGKFGLSLLDVESVTTSPPNRAHVVSRGTVDPSGKAKLRTAKSAKLDQRLEPDGFGPYQPTTRARIAVECSGGSADTVKIKNLRVRFKMIGREWNQDAPLAPPVYVRCVPGRD